jgi:TRAP-type C4-dicarboxylate transport system permease small subunit
MAVALVGVAVMVCMQVLFRFVLGSPLHYTEEVARYLTIWAALLGASLGVRSGTHFAVSYVVNRAPRGVARVLRAIAQLLVGAFLVAFLLTSLAYVESALVQSSPAARIPMALVYAAAPVGSGLMLFFMVTGLIGHSVRPLPTELIVEDLA